MSRGGSEVVPSSRRCAPCSMPGAGDSTAASCCSKPRRRSLPGLAPPAPHLLVDPFLLRSKCLLQLAVSKLMEQGLVVRQGYGAWAALTVRGLRGSKPDSGTRLQPCTAALAARSSTTGLCSSPQLLHPPPALHAASVRRPRRPPPPHFPPLLSPSACQVPDAALPRAEALAFSEFPDEGQLPLYAAGAGAAHRRGPCLRRHSSPRQFGTRMSGASSGAAWVVLCLQHGLRARLQCCDVCCVFTSL